VPSVALADGLSRAVRWYEARGCCEDGDGQMRSSVIIPSFQSAATIRACLTAVLRRTSRSLRSHRGRQRSDDTAEIITKEYPQVRVLKVVDASVGGVGRNWPERGERIGAGVPRLGMHPSPPTGCGVCASRSKTARTTVGGAIGNANGSNARELGGVFCEFREFLPGGPATDGTYLTPARGLPAGDVLEDRRFPRRLLSARRQVF